MRVDPEVRLQWREPVLLHLTDRIDSAGHYVVWLPDSSTKRARVWVGLQGVQIGSERVLAARRSGVILLTSAAPINSPADAVCHERRFAAHVFLGWAAVLAVGAAIWWMPRPDDQNP
jgi:hypothetical protein